LQISYEDFVFIDFGAGKGRTLLIASLFGFKRIIGVEFARELVEIARENVKRFVCRAEIMHADAAEYRVPDDNLVAYFYNPFGPEVLRRVLMGLRSLVLRRRVYLIYVNPQYHSVIQEFAIERGMINGAKIYEMEAYRRET
jgi:predicted RNA methylase